MELLKNNFFKRIIVTISLFMLLISYVITPTSNAAVKTQMEDGEFYYAGTTTGSYIVTENIFDWLLSVIGEIIDFLLGLMTMGGRMVFVGWTALFEELTTWALEASVGIPMDIEGNVNATSTDGFIDSSNNVTIEAIVYNQVPILNINLFSNPKSSCVSGTGQFFVVCETCYNQQNPVVEEENEEPRNIHAPKETKIIGKNQMICKMQECTCTECWDTLAKGGYLQTDDTGALIMEDGKPVRTSNAVTVIKDSVSKWYYVMRLIAIAAMLCVLLAVGIKMAISTVANDKALYKRMLVDWLVGMILLFLIHYYMVFAINVNETLVNFIKDTETGVTEVVKKELYMDEKSNSDIEIGIYQAVRTRAYDPKLINGTTGMILYITLVFYTIKFVFIYLKRYLTIIILTLLAPGAAFSYAIQKVLTGKSKSLSNWMHDYFMNVFIQTVHALVYTIFVSTALIISLNSISGMILAFIFINFMLKADDIFRKIFKMSGGSVDDAMNAASNMKNLMGSAKSAAGFMTAGNILKKSPVTKAVTAPLRTAGREGLLLAARTKAKIDNKKEKNSNDSSDISNTNTKNHEDINKQLDGMIEDIKKLRSRITPNGAAKKDFTDFLKGYSPKHGIGTDGEDAMDKEIADLEKIALVEDISEEDRRELANIRDKFDKLTNFTFGDVIKGHVSKLLDVNNYYEFDPKTGKRRRIYKGSKRVFDRRQNKWVKHSVDELIAEQLKAENLLGFTEKDKKLWKETTSLFKGTLLGMGSMFVGLGTVVSNPAVGMGLLATGISANTKFLDAAGVFDPNFKYRKPRVDEKNKKFKFNRFGKGAKQNIVKGIVANAEREKDAVVVENVRRNHKALYRTLKLGGAGLIAVGTVGLGSLTVAPIALGVGVVANTAGRGIKKFSGYSQNSLLGRISKNHFDQLKAQKRELLQDELRLLSKEEENEAKNYYKVLENSINESINAESQNIDKEAEEQRKMEEQLALKTGDAVKLESGETLILNKPTDIPQKADLADKVVLNIIDEAVAKTIVDKVLSQDDISGFKTETIEKDVKVAIEDKLVAHGLIEKGTLSKTLKGLDAQIDKSAKNIIDKELKASGSSSAEMTTLDKVLIDSVIMEKVEKKEIKSTEDISATMIMNSVDEKRKKLVERKTSTSVTDMLQATKGNIQMGQDITTNEKTGAEQIAYTQMLEISKEREASITSGIIEIKKMNRTVKPKTESERREEKKKRIAALEEILMAAAEDNYGVEASNDQAKYKSADEVIQELFDNTEDRKIAYALMDNIDNMKKINRRGDKAKMKTSDPNYHRAKNNEDRKKAFDKYGNKISNGDREYTNGDGVKDISKELYGPVTDVVSVIKGLSNDKKTKK